MNKKKEIIRFALYALVVVLLNIAFQTMFFRIDLTSTQSFSLTDASKKMVSELQEPLTVKVFITENLPQPYNNLEQNLRDTLQEYALVGNKNFNYDIYTIKNLDNDKAESSGEYEKEAQSYGINPIQIQKVEQSEINLTSAYMGAVFIHADMIETLPAINPNENIEYVITSAVTKMQQKTSKLLSLTDDIQMKLYLSPGIFQIANQLKEYPVNLERMVKSLNKINYNRISFEWIEDDAKSKLEAEQYGIKPFRFKDSSGKINDYYASTVIQYGNKYSTFDAIKEGTFGYNIQDPGLLFDQLEGAIDRIIGIGNKIAWLNDHGTLAMYGSNSMLYYKPSASSFTGLVSKRYTMTPISISEKLLPDDAQTLIIARPQPTLSFSDWELYQIDQFLMNGKNVAVFMNGFMEYSSEEGMGSQPPVYLARNTGLEKLLDHYGLNVKQAIVYDEYCYHNQQKDDSGIKDVPIYNAPKIKSEKINKKLPYMKGLEEMITLNASPVEIKEDLPEGCSANVLYSSSDTSWILEDSKKVNLYNPMMIIPPSDEERKSYPMAAVLEGSFTSYYAEKGVPERPETEPADQDQNEGYLIKVDQISREENMIKSTDSGKLFVFGSSMNLEDSLVDPDGVSPAAIMAMNIVDYMNGNGDFALMRQKGMGIKLIKDIPSATKTIIKTINIVVVPLFVVAASLFAWMHWRRRQRKIAAEFSEAKDE